MTPTAPRATPRKGDTAAANATAGPVALSPSPGTQSRHHNQQHAQLPLNGTAPPPDGNDLFQKALKFVMQVREQFGADSATNKAFSAILKDYQAAKDVPTTVLRVKRLFDGYPDLVQGFAVFIPQTEQRAML